MDEKKINSEQASETNNPGVHPLEKIKDDFDPDKARRLKSSGDGDNPNIPPDFETFYRQMENPLDNDDALIKICKIYSKTNNTDFYSCLQTMGLPDKEYLHTNIDDVDEFEKGMYGRWKKSLLDMKNEDYLAGREKGIMGQGLIYIRNLVKAHPECETEDDLSAVIKRSYNRKDAEAMQGYLSKYGWSHDDGWRHVKSNRVHLKQEGKINVEHRFYLNTDTTIMYGFANRYIEECEKANIPYYFKFTDTARKRSDNIVVYSSTNNLLKNLEIIHRIKENNPDYANSIYEPPLMTGVVDGNIGYGAEPNETVKKNTLDSSYNAVRAQILENAIKGAFIEWCALNYNKVLDFTDEKLTLSQFFAKKEMRKIHQLQVESFNKSLKKGGEKYAEEQTGFTRGDLTLKTGKFSRIEQNLAIYFKDVIEDVRKGKIADLRVEKRNGEYLQIGTPWFSATLERITGEIAEHEPTFLQEIRRRVQKKCAEVGIDEMKFVFNKN